MIIVCLALVGAALVVIGVALVLADVALLYVALGLAGVSTALTAVEFLRGTLLARRPDGHWRQGAGVVDTTRTDVLGKAPVGVASVDTGPSLPSLPMEGEESATVTPAPGPGPARAVTFGEPERWDPPRLRERWEPPPAPAGQGGGEDDRPVAPSASSPGEGEHTPEAQPSGEPETAGEAEAVEPAAPEAGAPPATPTAGGTGTEDGERTASPPEETASDVPETAAPGIPEPADDDDAAGEAVPPDQPEPTQEPQEPQEPEDTAEETGRDGESTAVYGGITWEAEDDPDLDSDLVAEVTDPPETDGGAPAEPAAREATGVIADDTPTGSEPAPETSPDGAPDSGEALRPPEGTDTPGAAEGEEATEAEGTEREEPAPKDPA